MDIDLPPSPTRTAGATCGPSTRSPRPSSSPPSPPRRSTCCPSPPPRGLPALAALALRRPLMMPIEVGPESPRRRTTLPPSPPPSRRRSATEPAPLCMIYSTNSSCLFKEKLTHALRYFKESTDQHLLVQVWAPVKSGDRYVLITSGQPLYLTTRALGCFSTGLCLSGHQMQYYSSTEYPRLNHAISYNAHGTVALPVFDPSVQSCIAVVELIMTSKKINYADEVDKVCKALEAVNLKSTEILEHPNVQICNEGRQSALVEILEILTVVCEEHNVLAHGGGVKKSCLSFDGSCMGKSVCQPVMWHFIPYTGDDYYMLEFFLPPSCKDEDDQNALLESILGLINQSSLQLSNVIRIENEDFKTVHFENSEGFHESPGRQYKFTTSRAHVREAPKNQTFVCQPIASMFLEPQEPQPNPEGFTKNLSKNQSYHFPGCSLRILTSRFRFRVLAAAMALKDEVAKRLRMDAGMFDIKYLDDDHEWVKLACNADLEECIEISRHSGTHVIRLLVSDVAAHIGSSCGSSG
ncbi:hypothetical protein ZWY2020_019649 [Hordeum vulgare]|nr:hypothetical protein ZWY2020_019649 [Hordeum vulgare]